MASCALVFPYCSGFPQRVGGQPGPGHSGKRLLWAQGRWCRSTSSWGDGAGEASAKLRLQQFIEELLEAGRPGRRQLQVISSSCGNTPSASLGSGGGSWCWAQCTRAPGRVVSALPSLLCLPS